MSDLRAPKPIATVFGAKGMLGREVVLALEQRGHAVTAVDLPEVDLCDPTAVESALRQAEFCVNCAAYTKVDDAESEPEQAFRANVKGPRILGAACAKANVPLVHLSTDYVFDGTSNRPYRTTDLPNPQGVYARSKWEGEKAVLEAGGPAWIVRTAWLFGPGGRSFPASILRAVRAGRALRVVADQTGCPTYAPDLAEVIARMPDVWPRFGILHAVGPEAMSWYEFAVRIVRASSQREGKEPPPIEPIRTEDWPTPAPRPRYSVLDTSEGWPPGLLPMPSVQSAIGRFLQEAS